MGRRTKRRRRRKGGQLSMYTIAKLKGKMHKLRLGLKSHMKENAQSIHQIAAGNSNVRQNVTHLTHADMQVMDAMLQTMAEHGVDATEDTATFITAAGKKMVSIGNKGANVVAEYAPGMGQKLHDWFMPILNKSGTNLTAAFNIAKDKLGNAVGWLHFDKPKAPDLTKATQYVKDIYDKLPTKEKIMGFVKVDGKTFSFVVDGGKATVKGVGSFLGKIGDYVKSGAGTIGTMAGNVDTRALLKGAQAVGSAGLKGAQVVGSVGLKGGKFVMGGIKFGGQIVWQVGQPFIAIGKFFGSGIVKFLQALWPIFRFFGWIICGFFEILGALAGMHGGKRKRRTKRRRRRKRTKKKRRKRTKKKRRKRRT